MNVILVNIWCFWFDSIVSVLIVFCFVFGFFKIWLLYMIIVLVFRIIFFLWCEVMFIVFCLVKFIIILDGVYNGLMIFLIVLMWMVKGMWSCWSNFFWWGEFEVKINVCFIYFIFVFWFKKEGYIVILVILFLNDNK